MKLSLGFFDSLFGEKVPFEINDAQGNPVKRVMTKKYYDKMIQDGKMSVIKPMNAKVFNSVSGLSEVQYKWGEVISEETYNKFFDKITGFIYIFEFYEKGEIQRIVMKKEKFDDTINQVENV